MKDHIDPHIPKRTRLTVDNLFKEIINLPLQIIFYICGVLLTGFSLSTILSRFNTANSIGIIAFYMSALLVIILTHEMGHIIALTLARFELNMLVVGPIIFLFINERVSVKVNLFRPLAGFTMATPKDTVNLNKRLLSGVIGGPASGFVVALITFAGYLLVGKEYALLSAWLLTTAGYAALLTAYNLLPISNSLVSTDGEKIWALLHQNDEARRLIASYTLLGENYSGVRPSQWETKWISILLDPNSAPIYQIQGHIFAYLNALDRNEFESAKQHLEISLATRNISVVFPVNINLEATYFYAAVQNNAAEAQKWHPKTSRHLMAEAQSYARADAALRIAQNQFVAAHNQINVGLRIIESLPQTGLRIAEQEWLKNMENEIIANQTT